MMHTCTMGITCLRAPSPNPTLLVPLDLGIDSANAALDGEEVQHKQRKARRRRKTWEPLDRHNEPFVELLAKRKAQPCMDFIMRNIVRGGSIGNVSLGSNILKLCMLFRWGAEWSQKKWEMATGDDMLGHWVRAMRFVHPSLNACWCFSIKTIVQASTSFLSLCCCLRCSLCTCTASRLAIPWF